VECLNYVVNVDLNPCKNVKQMIPNDYHLIIIAFVGFGTM
jgi:hypothetical protein